MRLVLFLALAQKLSDEPDLAEQLRELAASVDRVSAQVRDDAQVPNADRLQRMRLHDAMPKLEEQARTAAQVVMTRLQEAKEAAASMDGLDQKKADEAMLVFKRTLRVCDAWIAEAAPIESNATGLTNWLTPRAKASAEAEQLSGLISKITQTKTVIEEMKPTFEKGVARIEKFLSAQSKTKRAK